jgi:hypothetical protein
MHDQELMVILLSSLSIDCAQLAMTSFLAMAERAHEDNEG